LILRDHVVQESAKAATVDHTGTGKRKEARLQSPGPRGKRVGLIGLGDGIIKGGGVLQAAQPEGSLHHDISPLSNKIVAHSPTRGKTPPARRPGHRRRSRRAARIILMSANEKSEPEQACGKNYSPQVGNLNN